IDGRVVVLARGSADADKLAGQLVEIRCKPLDRRDAEMTASVSAGWVRAAQAPTDERGWQMIAGNRDAYHTTDGPEVMLSGVMEKEIYSGGGPLTSDGTNRAYTDPISGAVVMAYPGATYLLRSDRGITRLETEEAFKRLLGCPVELRCKAIDRTYTGAWRWRVGALRVTGPSAAATTRGRAEE
ncbi:MAG: hypothetical protein PHU85_20275, partial [Phycisphaerae bacterium]|nr:hypothetical protein [Phycisphaerae bacterium]